MLPEEIKLPENTAKKYRVKGHAKHGHVPGLKFKKGDFPMVNFETITPEEAKVLVSKNFPYLEEIPKEKDTAEKATTKK